MEPVKTLHIVGYKNSGKTTLITNWIKRLNEAGKKVAVIKHHGHGAKLAMPAEHKDSMRYLTAGAGTSIVSGGGFTQHMLQEELDFAALYEMALADEPDVVLVEGYKMEAGAKVVLVREEADWDSLKQLHDILLVVGLEADVPGKDQIPARAHQKALDAWLLKWLNDTAQ